MYALSGRRKKLCRSTRRRQAERVDRPRSVRDRVLDLQHGEAMSGDEPTLCRVNRLLASYRVRPVMLSDVCVQSGELLDI